MNKTALAFLSGMLWGFSMTVIPIHFYVVQPMKEEAIKRGCAEMKLKTPTSTEAVFTWK
jgi:hypothetical protein